MRRDSASGLLIPIFLYDRASSIFSRDGRLVWFSPVWLRSDAATRHELLGLRYLEFMAPGEAKRFLRWLTVGTLHIEFHYYSPTLMRWTLVSMAKTRFDDAHWLCLGERLAPRFNFEPPNLELSE